MERRSLHNVPDDELLARLADLLHRSRSTESDLVAHIAEVDERRLYAREAFPSMFAYCTEALHLSEAEAYLRIAAARASREHPLLLDMLADGRLHLSGVGKLAPHLTRENAPALLARAAHRTKRQIEELVAEFAPRPDAPTLVRRLPARPPSVAPGPGPSTQEREPLPLAGAAGRGLRPDAVAPSAPLAVAPAEKDPPSVPVRPGSIEPLAPARYKIQFTASARLRDKLERLQVLMRSQVPDGDLAALIEAAVTEKVERLEAKRFARVAAPRKRLAETSVTPTTRQVPAAVKRAVDQRDSGRCRYVDQQGRRCEARHGLEFHHRRPFGLGGDHSVDNISLLCAAHNDRLAEVDYGREAMARHRRAGSPRADANAVALRPRRATRPRRRWPRGRWPRPSHGQ